MQDCYIENKTKLQKCLSKSVKEKRLNLNKSISLLSAEVGMTKSMWADLEKGRKDPQLSTIWRISQGLDIPLSVLIKEIEDNLGNDFTLIE